MSRDLKEVRGHVTWIWKNILGGPQKQKVLGLFIERQGQGDWSLLSTGTVSGGLGTGEERSRESIRQ